MKFPLPFLFLLLFLNLNAQDSTKGYWSAGFSFNGGYAGHDELNAYLQRADVFGSGADFNSWRFGLGPSIRYCFKDRFEGGIELLSTAAYPCETSQARFTISRRYFFLHFSLYYLRREKIRASGGLLFGSSGLAVTVSETYDTVRFVPDDPLPPHKVFTANQMLFLNNGSTFGLQHELDWVFARSHKKRLKSTWIFSAGLIVRASYVLTDNSWAYDKDNVERSLHFTAVRSAEPFQFSAGIIFHWSFLPDPG